MLRNQDTIAAVSTPPGEGGIGIVRLSGPRALEIAGLLFKAKNAKKLSHFKLHYGWVKDPQSRELIDEVLLAVMRSPHSYTREDVVEFQCHGGNSPLKKVLELSLKYGARLAENGEFTRRALENGRIDLLQAEAALELIRAKTESALIPAGLQLQGHFSRKIGDLREKLLNWLTLLEAELEFAEEELSALKQKELLTAMHQALNDLDKFLKAGECGKILREGIALVIVGRPNVGKSSLLNRLLGEDRAIVTEIPGTTRDSLEEWFNLYGIPVKLIDTAGLRHPRDEIEYLGVERARQNLKKAEIALLVLDGSESLKMEDLAILEEVKGKTCFCLLNKSDLPAKLQLKTLKKTFPPDQILKISAQTGAGISRLLKCLKEFISRDFAALPESGIILNLRQRESLKKARKFLALAGQSLEKNYSPEFIISDLKKALAGLGELTGDHITQAVLDRIFSEFCIGK